MNLLSRIRIRSKLAGMVVLSVVAVCAIVAWSASLSQKRMLDDRIAQLRTLGVSFSEELPRGLNSTHSALLEAPEGTALLLLHGDS